MRRVAVVVGMVGLLVAPGGATEVFRADFAAADLIAWTVYDMGRQSGPSRWHVQNGTLRQETNLFHTPFGGRDAASQEWLGTVIIAGDPTWADYRFSFRFMTADDDGIGGIVRFADTGNYLAFQLDREAGFFQLSEKVNGAFYLLAGGEASYQQNHWHECVIRCVGRRVEVALDGQFIAATDVAVPARGAIGLLTRGCERSAFDDVVVDSAPGPTLESDAARQARRLNEWLDRCEPARLAVLPGQTLTLPVPDDLGPAAATVSANVVDSTGQPLTRPRALVAGESAALWTYPGGAPGLYLLRLSHGERTADLPFNAWDRYPTDIGVCAHRGDLKSYPENTVPAFVSAVAKGADMVELDVARTRDGHLVVMHDDTVDRTTDGRGRVADLTLAEVKQLDAGTWKADRFAGVRVPTLAEALAVIPARVLVNCHLKAGVGAAVATLLSDLGKVDHCFLACDRANAEAARAVNPAIAICNMQGQRAASSGYPEETIAMGARFIQLLGWHRSTPAVAARLRAAGVTVNYYGTSDPAFFRLLIEAGVQYPLVDDLDAVMPVLRELRGQ